MKNDRKNTNKDVILFGTGNYFDNYMLCHKDKNVPIFAVDNNKEKWGTTKAGIEIKSPEELTKREPDSFYVVICMANPKAAKQQLTEMGIMDFQSYQEIPMEDREIVTYVDCQKYPADDYLRQDMEMARRLDAGQAPYDWGYVPGVFDLFHVGYLNLIRNSKLRCEHLIVGVLTDELVYHFKQKYPVIPYAQRAAIIESLEMVDRVVPVDFENTRKIDAWKKYHYDCHFSGDDHVGHWNDVMEELRKRGSNMEFFSYTEGISSTSIRKSMQE